MKESDRLKKIVRDKYAGIALAPGQNCCCGEKETELKYSVLSQDYKKLDGYMEDADLHLGCGVPTEYAGMKKGDRVLDLGSGAGNDVFVARRIVGESGAVTGLDFTDEMLAKARQNNEKMAYTNVNFVKGDIENIPLPAKSFDVVISNCVLNLVPDKQKAFSEIHRVLKPGGHFCVSDIVLKGTLPDELLNAAELYADCLSGALQMDDYMKAIRENGFGKVELKSEVRKHITDEFLLENVSQEAVDAFRASGAGIYSITVVGSL